VLRDRRAADREQVGEFADRPRSLGQTLDDGPSSPVAQSVPPLAASVSVHKRLVWAYTHMLSRIPRLHGY